MKIATWNVNGIRAREAQFLEWLERELPDVVCLQEIKSPPSKIPPALCELRGYHCYWHGERAYSGVGLHIRREAFAAEPRFFHPPFDCETRIVAAEIGALTVASVYVPNGGKDFPAKMRFLEELERYAAAVCGRGADLIICGDINITRTDRDVHPKERNPMLYGQRPDEREMFERILACGLVDVGRALDPENENLFTWWPPWRRLRERNIGWRLDYILASPRLAARAKTCVVQREFGTSDHAPVVAVFDLEAASAAAAP
ncbi:MAG TPA: exodeoxyribonuclease III [candidate division Zixibacteria bacterium]|nr:exodeoxyribonuclease III [candidate division Zixibacteria bacterium]